MSLAYLFCLGLAALLLSFLCRQIASLYCSPIRLLNGPSSPSWLYGHFRQISTVRNSVLMQEWAQSYGANCLIRWFGMMPSLWTIDPQTVNYVLTRAYEFEKPMEGRKHTARLIGKSILVSEGDVHKKQRKIMSPAFGSAQIRALHQVFVDQAKDLRDIWRHRITAAGGRARLNVIEGLSSATLEAIGVAGFNYQLGALGSDGERNELNMAFRAIFKKPPSLSLMRVIMDIFPLFDIFPDERTKRLKEGKIIANKIGMQLIRERKDAVCSQSNGVDKSDLQGRDLLTLLVKANMDKDVPENQRLSDEEVLAQIPTFLAAGHETTSTALAWCLYALSKHPQVQDRLREELLEVTSRCPSAEDIASLPYLDGVVKETLRIYCPITTTLRVATHDDTLPVSQPFIDRNGVMQTGIRVSKGTRIVIPILGMNECPVIWGEDAFEFIPDRWNSLPPEAAKAPGVWGNLLTFGSGAKSCIGYKFAVSEMKAMLFTLLRAFEFAIDPADDNVERAGTFLQRPSLSDQAEKGAQLPLVVREYVH